MGELISVIIAVYNSEPYIKRCIDSVINQSYKNLEIIIVDDGSVDDSGKIADEYAATDKRIIVVHKENGGLPSTRNAGLDIARGAYVAFVDGDDWIDVKHIELLYAACRKGADVAVVDYVITDGSDAESSYDDKTSIYSGKELYDDREYFFDTKSVVAWNKIYSIRCFDDLRFKVGSVCEDVFTVYKAVYPCEKVAVTNARTYFYYRNDSGIIRAPLTVKKLDGIAAYAEQYDYFDKLGDTVARDYAAEKIYGLSAYYYALALRKGVENKKEIIRALKKYYKENFKRFKNVVKVKFIEKLLIKLSCGNLGMTYPIARYRRNRIK